MGIVEVLDDQVDLRYIRLNKAASRYVGKTPEVVEGMLASQIGVNEAVRSLWIDQCRRSEKLGLPVEFDYQREMPDGVHTLTATTSKIESSL
jgi:PAS domain-containing protein